MIFGIVFKPHPLLSYVAYSQMFSNIEGSLQVKGQQCNEKRHIWAPNVHVGRLIPITTFR